MKKLGILFCIFSILILSILTISAQGSFLDKNEKISSFYENYLLPEADSINTLEQELEDPNYLPIIILSGFLIIIAIIFEIVYFFPTSKVTSIIIAIGALMVMTILGTIKQILGWSLSLMSLFTGIGLAAGMWITFLIAIAISIGLLFGARWAKKMIKRIKLSKKLSQRQKREAEREANIAGLEAEAVAASQ